MTKPAKITGWIFAAASVAVAAIYLVWIRPQGGLQYQDHMFETGAAVATALFVIALFVERMMAVVYALLFGDAQREAELDIAFAASPAEERNAARVLADMLGFKERLRLLLGFAAGLFVSGAGVRTLESLLKATAPPNPSLFHATDIILTAGLIAGGSNGLAFIIQLLKDRISHPGGGQIAALRARLMTTT